MGASRIEFRLRFAIYCVIFTLGFWAPWIGTRSLGRHHSLLEWLALELSRLGLLRFHTATVAVIVTASLAAAAAVVLRLWGSACLGAATVHHGQMQAASLMADGPFRYVRNPLYLGTWCMTIAMAFLMPPTGALFTVVLITIFQVRLILGEEAFLAARLGEPYGEYLRAVPRLVPRLRTGLQSTGNRPEWLRAVLSELLPIGVFITLAFLSWRYDNLLMLRAVLVSLGVSLVARAVVMRPATKSVAAE